MKRRVRGGITRAFGTALGVGAAAFAATLGALLVVYPRVPGPGGGARVEVVIPQGAGPSTVGRLLEEAGVVRSGPLFALHLRVAGVLPRLRHGRHPLRDDATPAEVLDRIARPAPGDTARVTVPEGNDLYDVARVLDEAGIVAASDFLSSARDAARLAGLGVRASTAEGYLFPDTYELRAAESPSAADDVVTRMIENFHRRTAFLLAGLEPRRRHEVIVLASIVEREARLAEERPRIAAVFQNRLASPGFEPRILQADPTVSYGCRVFPFAPSCGGFDGRLTRRQLRDPENPYNTYLHPGLPPGPISNPGLAALGAALHPADTDELYFVARGDGTHAFARTLSEHNQNVQRYVRSR